MNARWARKNTTTGTAIVISAAAWMSVGCVDVQGVVLLDRDRQRSAAPACRPGTAAAGRSRSTRRRSGTGVTAVMAGTDSGRMTERRIRNGLAPSIIAASSRSRGIDMKYWRSRNTLNAFAKKWGTISGSHVPFQPSFVKIDVGRDQGHLERQDDRGDQDDEQDVLAREPEPGEAVGHQRRGQHRAERAQHRDGGRVEEQPREVQLGPGRREVVDLRCERPGLLERPPAPCQTKASASDRPGRRTYARLASLLDQHQVAGHAVDGDRVDRRTPRPGTCPSAGAAG